jgi:predicted nucleic acid-binding protein
LIADALPLALKTSATLYDALYVVVAIQKGTQVLTGDQPMCNAFAKLGCCTHIGDFSL